MGEGKERVRRRSGDWKRGWRGVWREREGERGGRSKGSVKVEGKMGEVRIRCRGGCKAS